MEQKLPATQERPMKEQTVPMKPTGTAWSRSSCSATKEPTEWGLKEAQPLDTPSGVPQAGAPAHGEKPAMGWEGWDSCHPWRSMWRSSLLKGRPCGIQSDAEAVLGEQQPMGSPCGISFRRMAFHRRVGRCFLACFYFSLSYSFINRL